MEVAAGKAVAVTDQVTRRAVEGELEILDRFGDRDNVTERRSSVATSADMPSPIVP